MRDRSGSKNGFSDTWAGTRVPGDVDLERPGGQVGGRDALVAADPGDPARGAQRVAETAAADVADRLVVPVDRLVAVEVVVG